MILIGRGLDPRETLERGKARERFESREVSKGQSGSVKVRRGREGPACAVFKVLGSAAIQRSRRKEPQEFPVTIA